MRNNKGIRMRMNIRSMIILAVFLLSNIALVEALEITVSDYDPIPAEAGKAVNVWFNVQNSDYDEAENDVYIKVTPMDGLELSAGEDSEKKIGILPAGNSQIIQFRLFVKDKAFEGANIIEASLRSDKGSFKKDLSIEVTEKDLKEVDINIGDIESDPTRIKPDDDNVKLDVTLQNLGDGTAKGVKAELVDLPVGVSLSESYSGTSLLGNIEADSTGTATFYIDVDETTVPKEHAAAVKLSYKYKPDEDEDDYLFEEKVLPLKLAIKPIPIYNITGIELNPQVLTAGDKDVKIKITIKNIGEEEGESVRLKVYGKTEQPLTFDDSSDFIAPSLKPGEEGQGTLQFNIEDDANLQKYFLDIEIKNIVNDDVLTYNKKVPIDITNPKPNNPWKLVSFFALIVVLVVIYLIVKGLKKKKQKPKAKKVGSSYGKDYLDKMDKD